MTDEIRAQRAAECVGLGVQKASDFLRSKALKSLTGQAYTPQNLEIESLERRFDRAFGVFRSEDEWDKRLPEQIIQQLENDAAAATEEGL